MEHTIQQLASLTQAKHKQVEALQRLQPTPPKMYLARPSNLEGLKTPVLSVGWASCQAGGRLEGWRGFVTPSTPRLTRGEGTAEPSKGVLIVRRGRPHHGSLSRISKRVPGHAGPPGHSVRQGHPMGRPATHGWAPWSEGPTRR